MLTNVIRAIPTLLLPAFLYAVVASTMSNEAVNASLATPFFSMILPSGAHWEITRGEGFLMLSALCLFVEIVKSTSVSRWALVENGLAFVLFTLAFILFLLNPVFGTNEFFLLVIMMLLDFIAGFVVMTISARRDVSFGH